MKKVHNHRELQAIISIFHDEVSKYLSNEFNQLYEYLNRGESIKEFQLSANQALVIISKKEEVRKLFENTALELEFMEEDQLQNHTIHRIGIYHGGDVQLCYYITKNNEKLN